MEKEDVNEAMRLMEMSKDSLQADKSSTTRSVSSNLLSTGQTGRRPEPTRTGPARKCSFYFVLSSTVIATVVDVKPGQVQLSSIWLSHEKRGYTANQTV